MLKDHLLSEKTIGDRKKWFTELSELLCIEQVSLESCLMLICVGWY